MSPRRQRSLQSRIDCQHPGCAANPSARGDFGSTLGTGSSKPAEIVEEVLVVLGSSLSAPHRPASIRAVVPAGWHRTTDTLYGSFGTVASPRRDSCARQQPAVRDVPLEPGRPALPRAARGARRGDRGLVDRAGGYPRRRPGRHRPVLGGGSLPLLHAPLRGARGRPAPVQFGPRRGPPLVGGRAPGGAAGDRPARPRGAPGGGRRRVGSRRGPRPEVPSGTAPQGRRRGAGRARRGPCRRLSGLVAGLPLAAADAGGRVRQRALPAPGPGEAAAGGRPQPLRARVRVERDRRDRP